MIASPFVLRDSQTSVGGRAASIPHPYGHNPDSSFELKSDFWFWLLAHTNRFWGPRTLGKIYWANQGEGGGEVEVPSSHPILFDPIPSELIPFYAILNHFISFQARMAKETGGANPSSFFIIGIIMISKIIMRMIILL